MSDPNVIMVNVMKLMHKVVTFESVFRGTVSNIGHVPNSAEYFQTIFKLI